MLLSCLISPPKTAEAVSTIHSFKFKDTQGTKRISYNFTVRHHCFSIYIPSMERLVNDGKWHSSNRNGSEKSHRLPRTLFRKESWGRELNASQDGDRQMELSCWNLWRELPPIKAKRVQQEKVSSNKVFFPSRLTFTLFRAVGDPSRGG